MFLIFCFLSYLVTGIGSGWLAHEVPLCQIQECLDSGWWKDPLGQGNCHPKEKPNLKLIQKALVFPSAGRTFGKTTNLSGAGAHGLPGQPATSRWKKRAQRVKKSSHQSIYSFRGFFRKPFQSDSIAGPRFNTPASPAGCNEFEKSNRIVHRCPETRLWDS